VSTESTPTDDAEAIDALANAPRDAYSLLSRPTLELTDAELEIIVADLRRRREYFVKEGKKDDPRPKAKREPTTRASKEQRERNSAVLLEQLNLGDLGGLKL
jgi:hypothetical protein